MGDSEDEPFPLPPLWVPGSTEVAVPSSAAPEAPIALHHGSSDSDSELSERLRSEDGDLTSGPGYRSRDPEFGDRSAAEASSADAGRRGPATPESDAEDETHSTPTVAAVHPDHGDGDVESRDRPMDMGQAPPEAPSSRIGQAAPLLLVPGRAPEGSVGPPTVPGNDVAGKLYPSLIHVMDALSVWAVRAGFRVVTSGGYHEPKSDTTTKKIPIKCKRHGEYKGRGKKSLSAGQLAEKTKKCKCKFYVKAVRVAGGWRIDLEHHCLYHNHRMSHYVHRIERGRRALKASRQLVGALFETHSRPSHIGLVVSTIAGSGAVVPETDVSNARRTSAASAAEAVHFDENGILDTSMFKGLKETVREEDGTEKERYFWMVKPAVHIFRALPYVLVVDTTFGTNSERLSLMVFTTVDNFGYTVVLGGALLNRESTEACRWALDKLRSGLGEAAEVQTILSDESDAEMSAIATVFPTASNLLCTVHLWRRLLAQGASSFTNELREELSTVWRKMRKAWDETRLTTLYRRLMRHQNPVSGFRRL